MFTFFLLHIDTKILVEFSSFQQSEIFKECFLKPYSTSHYWSLIKGTEQQENIVFIIIFSKCDDSIAHFCNLSWGLDT